MRVQNKLDILQGTLDLMVLRTLSTLGSLHGYGIARRIEQVSGDHVILNQGTIYTSLVRLEERGWIRSKWGVSENNRRARFYTHHQGGREAARGRNRELGTARGGDGTRSCRVEGRTDDALASHDLVAAAGRCVSEGPAGSRVRRGAGHASRAPDRRSPRARAVRTRTRGAKRS